MDKVSRRHLMLSRAKDVLQQMMQLAVLILWISISSASAHERGVSPDHEPVVEELISLLKTRQSLDTALELAIEKANLKDIRGTDSFLTHLDEFVTWIPIERELVPKVLQFYSIVNQAPEDQLNEDGEFNVWMKRFVQVRGEFLDTPASASGIESFTSSPSYNIDDYFSGRSGWLTLNQFFAREIRPGKRPIAGFRDDNVILSPADAVFIGQWPKSRPGGESGEVLMQPIVRVFRGIVKPGMNDEFQSFFLDVALPLVRSQDGLLAVTIGLPSEVSPNEFLMISVWDSFDSLRKFAGEEWDKAVIDPREAHLLQETFVHHYHQPDA